MLAIRALNRTEKAMERMQGPLRVGQRDPRGPLLRLVPDHHLVADEEVDVVVVEAVRAVVEEAGAMEVGVVADGVVAVEVPAGTGNRRVLTPWLSARPHNIYLSSRALYPLFIIIHSTSRPRAHVISQCPSYQPSERKSLPRQPYFRFLPPFFPVAGFPPRPGSARA
jgi:hypothetical protein